MGPRATGKDAVATVVVDKMRRRMRQNGYHAHITLQVWELAWTRKHQPEHNKRMTSGVTPHLLSLLYYHSVIS